ncbi:RhuM family protein [Chitinophaga parva]|uniref:RhuM family protein n=1 Tax=Chitinophaga parva TaxID=2169414 RepID=UPI00196A4B71
MRPKCNRQVFLDSSKGREQICKTQDREAFPGYDYFRRYRVKSAQGTQFRIWANKVWKEHLVKGYSLNEKHSQEQQA